MTITVKIPAPETDFIDPRTGKLSKLWYQYFQQFSTETTDAVNTGGITTITEERTITNHFHYDMVGEEGPRGMRGPPGSPGLTKVVHIYLPADENEVHTIYRSF